MLFDRTRRAITRRAALLCVLVLACSGGGEPGGGDPTGPDNATSNAVGSITVSAGNNQNVGPGEVVPVRPVLKVLSDRNRPLQGASVSFTIENSKGTLDAASVTTDVNGEAIVPRWGAPLVLGEFALNATATGQVGTPKSTRVAATVTDAQVQSVTQAIPATGGTVTIPATVPPLGGLQIQVPPGSFPGSTTFSIAYGAAPNLPTHLTLASPLIGINAGNVVSDSIIYVDIPATGTRGTGQTIRAFVYTADNSLVPLPTYSTTATSIRVGITDFRPQPGYNDGIQFRLGSGVSPATPVAKSVASNFGIRLLIALWTVPTTGIFDTHFEMQKDNMSFINYGSFAHPGGYCAGSTVASGGWYLRSPPAREKFPPLLTPAETFGWSMEDQLNPAIRLANAMQSAYASDAVSNWKGSRMVQNDRSVWENVLYQLGHGSRPVYVEVWSADRSAGHAILAYKADAATGHVSISDPNFPERLDREMVWNEAIQRWAIYQSAPNAGASGVAYVLFADATYLFRENNADIQAIINSYIANGLVSSNPRAQGDITLKSGTVVSIDGETTTLNVQSRDNPLQVTIKNIGSGAFHRINSANGYSTPNGGQAITSNADVFTVPLESGQNKIGIVIQKTVPNPGTPPPATVNVWYDTKLLIVNRAQPALKFTVQPSNAKEGASLGAVQINLVDEDGGEVWEARTLSVTLEGGTAGAVLTGGGDVTTSAASGSVTLSGLSVDKEGTGYTLKVTGNLLQPVSSASFNITPAGNASFTGQVKHAVTNSGLAGVSVVATKDGGTESKGTTSSGGGDWTITGLSEGTYTIVASLTGYVSTSVSGQVAVNAGTVVEPIPLVPNGTPGGVFGNIRNATTSALITSLTTVEARSGMNNTAGAVAFSQATSTGTYALPNLPAGVYTLSATNPAFTPTTRTGVVVGGGPATQGPDLVMSPSGGVARIVLTWGSVPNDLDSHLTGPNNLTRFWVYYSNRGSCSQTPWVCLDVDDTNGNGPETMTFAQVTPGLYRYYVYDYSNRNNASSTVLRSSGAKVEFYVGNTLKGTWFVPSGTGNAWAVFTWDGTTVTPLNQIYTISGVPQPARILNPPLTPTMMEELQRLSTLPAKPPQ